MLSGLDISLLSLERVSVLVRYLGRTPVLSEGLPELSTAALLLRVVLSAGGTRPAPTGAERRGAFEQECDTLEQTIKKGFQ